MILDPSLERTIISLAVMAMSTILLIELPQDAAVLLPLIGSWMGAMIANWFNGLSNSATPTLPKAIVAPPVVHTDSPDAH